MPTGLAIVLGAWAVILTLPAEGSSGATSPAAGEANAVRQAVGIEGVTGWFALAPKASPPPQSVRKPFVIPVREPISEKTFEAMRRKASKAQGLGADLIVLDMDTDGGFVHPAREISRLLKLDLAPIHTVCLVRTRALSAGALIALACDEIVMTSVGALGDAAPVSMGGALEGVDREKIEAELRREFRESAERNGYSVPLAEAMVSIGLEVWLVQDKDSQELRFVSRDRLPFTVKAPPGVTTAPSDPNAEWEVVRVIDPGTQLLNMNSREALAYGFASAIVEVPAEQPFGPLLARYGFTGAPTVLADTWSEQVVEFLTSPGVSALLFFVAILCAYIEINTPGFGLPGAIALICFGIVFGSRYLVGMAQWWEIALIVVGVLLLLAEIFLIPGFGVAGIMGILLILAGVLATAIPNPPSRFPLPRTSLDWDFFARTVFGMGVGLVAAVVAAMLLAQHLPRIPVARKLVLSEAVPFEGAPVAEDSPFRRVQVGDVGTVENPCRPVGKVRFGERLLDASSDDEFIEAGASVRVARKDANRLVVERADRA